VVMIKAFATYLYSDLDDLLLFSFLQLAYVPQNNEVVNTLVLDVVQRFAAQ
jgi:hypothetical protein